MEQRVEKEPNLILDIENPPVFCEVSEQDGFIVKDTFSKERRIRKYTYDLLKKAQKNLPPGYQFVIYEAYRPLKVQISEWERMKAKIEAENPDFTPEDVLIRLEDFVANPYTTGSGHQSGAAVDITLAFQGQECDMGSPINEAIPESYTACEAISEEGKKNRQLLKTVLEDVGFVNYPSEWWHYSFGDRLWARLTGSALAIFGKVDI